MNKIALLNLGDQNKFIPLRLGVAVFASYDLAVKMKLSQKWSDCELNLLQASAKATFDNKIIDKVNKMLTNQTGENIKAACDEYCKKLTEEIAKDESKHNT